ncbi:MAG: hypothetical protein HDT46_11430 [Ruminococcaceae bacterium]|nr:hypothetical protein [Oscillospiraceae bacterium]
MNKADIIKPITVAREEFINKTVEACNNSGLPFFAIKDILEQMIQNVDSAAKAEYKRDKERYEAQLKECENNQEEQNETVREGVGEICRK